MHDWHVLIAACETIRPLKILSGTWLPSTHKAVWQADRSPSPCPQAGPRYVCSKEAIAGVAAIQLMKGVYEQAATIIVEQLGKGRKTGVGSKSWSARPVISLVVKDG
jgi:hypothetical protein